MKKLFLFIFVIVVLGQKTKACTCTSTLTTFCKSVEVANDKSIIVRAFIEEQSNNGAKLRILNLYKGNETKGTIQVWGGDGGNCRTGIGRVGQTFIMILTRLERVSASRLNEQIGDYETWILCAVSQVLVENGKLKGLLTEEKNQTVDDTDPNRLPFCPNFKTDLEFLKNVQVSPNPTENILNFKNLSSKIDVEIFDVLGRLIQQNTVFPNQDFVNVADLPNGLYIMRFRRNVAIHIVKFVKI